MEDRMNGAKNDAPLLLAWIFGCLLLGGLVFFFADSLRNRALLNQVNAYLRERGVKFSLALDDKPLGFRASLGLRRPRFTISGSKNKAMLYPVSSDGYTAACLAILSSEGSVMELLPLSRNSDRLLSRFSPGLTALYIDRLSASETARLKARSAE